VTVPILADKVAVVTGAAQGIGRDAALEFAASGATVVVADIDEAGGEATATRIAEAGGTAAFLRTDVTQEADVEALVAFAVERFGRLDCALNNAGGNVRPSPITECDERNWDHVVGLNLKSVFLCVKHELRQMLEQGAGAIVNTASAASYRASVTDPIYTTAKHGVSGLTRAAAIEVAASGIRVNAVCPGVTLTDGLVERGGARDREPGDVLAARLMPSRRLLQGSEIGAAAAWLCSDLASGLTGAVIPVDGGMSAV